MFITIYSLDAAYEPSVLDMGGAVIPHEIGNVIDVELDCTKHDIKLNFCRDMVAMTDCKTFLALNRDEFLAIKIS